MQIAAPRAGGAGGGRGQGQQGQDQGQGPVVTPPFQATLSGTLKESWNDNLALTSNNQRHDEITTITPELLLSAHGTSTNVGLNYTGGYNRYAENSEFDSFSHNGIATVSSGWFDQRLLLNAQGSVNEPNINPTGAVGAGDQSSPINRVRILTYSAGPKLQAPLGEFADVQLGATHSETRDEQISSVQSIQSPTAAPGGGAAIPTSLSGTTGNQAHAEMKSGGEFTRLLWDLSADVSQSRLQEGQFGQQSYQLASEYKIYDDFGLLLQGGFDYFHGLGVGSNNNGPFYDGGVHWTPSPNTELRMGGGWRDGKPYFFGLLNEQLGGFTNLRITHDVKVTSDALNTFDTLESLVQDAQGRYLDPLSGLAASPGSSAFQLSNSVYRQSTTQGILTRSGMRDSFSLVVQVASQNVLSNPATNVSILTGTPLAQATTTASANLAWSHSLTPNLTASLTGGVNAIVASSLPSGKTKRALGTAEMSYTLGENTSLEAQYAFSDSLVPAGANVQSTFGSTTGRVWQDLVFVALKRKF